MVRFPRIFGASAAVALLFVAASWSGGCATAGDGTNPSPLDTGDASASGDAAACTLDADCPKGQHCVRGACAATGTGCTTNAQCATGTVCNTTSKTCVECLGDPNCSAPKPHCDTGTNKCVACRPGQNDCATGQICVSGSCVAGCNTDGDCAGSGGDAGAPPAHCDTTTHTCVQCLDDTGCPPGSVCTSKQCVPGCNAQHACPSGAACCSGQCASLTTTSNCTACGAACDTTNSQGAACSATTCTYTGCSGGFTDCNKTAPDTDGCETNTGTSTTSCGACGRGCSTANVQTAACSNGTCTSTCNAGWGNCNKPAAPAADDGCESNLTTCVGSPCCGTLCTGLHQNGLGGTYADCHAFGIPGNSGSYTTTMANEAAASWPSGGSVISGTCWTNDQCVGNQTASQCAVWCYSGSTAPGHVLLTSGTGACGTACCCPTATDGTWN